MPFGSQYPQGNISFIGAIYLPTVTVPNVNANSTANQNVTVTGAVVGDMIFWNWLGSVTGLNLDNVYVSAKDVLTFTWTNNTTSNITSTAAQPIQFLQVRPALVSYGVTALPTVF
jgi:hypothetical protein